MILSWLEGRRRRKILSSPFPGAWLVHLRNNVRHYSLLSEPEQGQLRGSLRVFIQISRGTRQHDGTGELLPFSGPFMSSWRPAWRQAAQAFVRSEETMIDLYNAATNQLLGSITEPDLQVLVDALEEESTQDRDYFVDAATIELIADGRATGHLVNLLRGALGSTEGVDIRWTRR